VIHHCVSTAHCLETKYSRCQLDGTSQYHSPWAHSFWSRMSCKSYKI